MQRGIKAVESKVIYGNPRDWMDIIARHPGHEYLPQEASAIARVYELLGQRTFKTLDEFSRNVFPLSTQAHETVTDNQLVTAFRLFELIFDAGHTPSPSDKIQLLTLLDAATRRWNAIPLSFDV